MQPKARSCVLRTVSARYESKRRNPAASVLARDARVEYVEDDASHPAVLAEGLHPAQWYETFILSIAVSRTACNAKSTSGMSSPAASRRLISSVTRPNAQEMSSGVIMRAG